MNTKEKGKIGEEAAVAYLKDSGYEILKRNYRQRFGEIDIIALDKASQEIVFVEVKARGSSSYGFPEEAIGKEKLKKINKAAQAYLIDKKEERDYRFDCLALEKAATGPGFKIKHYKNIGFD